jgi:hypothetical protein
MTRVKKRRERAESENMVYEKRSVFVAKKKKSFESTPSSMNERN